MAAPAPAPRLVDRLRRDAAAERSALVAGLRAPRASIPPKYFYDEAGLALFAQICALPEYYLARTERAIFEAHRGAIAAAAGSGRTRVDLGAGDGRKAATWLRALRPSRYCAVDIAGHAVRATLARYAREHPALESFGIVADFTRPLDFVADLGDGAVTFFYPGSSIGNFPRAEARALLASLARHAGTHPGSGLLIGVDARKDPRRLLAAYDDASGVTAAFNRNVLAHVNRLVDADFDPATFAHRATFDETAGRIAMHLEATRAMAVTVAGEPRLFAAGERIHTEDSFKYAPDAFAALLRDAGWARTACWQDAAGDFLVFYAS